MFFGLDGVISKHDEMVFMNLKPTVYRTPDMNIS